MILIGLSFWIYTDASDIGMGAVLSQVDENGIEKVIAYGSRLLSKPERNYCVTRRELLVVVTFVRQFRPYTCWDSGCSCELTMAH